MEGGSESVHTGVISERGARVSGSHDDAAGPSMDAGAADGGIFVKDVGQVFHSLQMPVHQIGRQTILVQAM